VATVARRQGAEVKVFYREAVEQTPASRKEVEHALQEGVEIRSSLTPVELVLGDDGRATAVRLVEVDWNAGKMEVREGSEFDIECDLVVAAIGQACDFTGMESLDNGRGLVTADKVYRVQGRDKLFAGGDVLRPHLLTTAIGHASIAAEGIDDLLHDHEPGRRPKVDVHHYKLLDKLRETGLEPSAYDHQQVRGTDSETYAVHNYEDRSHVEIVPSDELFLGHFSYTARNKRPEIHIDPAAVVGHFGERIEGLSEEAARKEADRCMSCGMCLECDNCVIYCPQVAVHRVKKDQRTMGRYVETDYVRCIGCHICADVCPTGYIQMGLGE
jgi:Pyruvate/2-oxoacid:ferredoxin oxidoreductase delta subunit